MIHTHRTRRTLARHCILRRHIIPPHLYSVPTFPSPLHETSVHCTPTPTPVAAITGATSGIISPEKLPPAINTAAFPSPYRHHYIPFHTPTSHIEMICPWVLGMHTRNVRGPTTGVWGNRAKGIYKMFEVRGMEEYMEAGDEGEWETDDEDVVEEMGMLLEVGAMGADGKELGRFIDMPDFELCGDAGLLEDGKGGGQGGGESGGEQDGDSECAVFI